MHRNIVRLSFLLVVAQFFSACMLLNPIKRRPIENISFQKKLKSVEKTILVHFAENIPGKPLVETVWDNNGAFWNEEESKQIGFTQNYKIIPVPGTVTAVNTGTIIVIPFGRYFTEMTKSATQVSFRISTFCYDTSCVKEALSKQTFDYSLSVGIKKFRVWETYLNKINYSTEIIYVFQGMTGGKNNGVVKKTLTDKSIGSPLSTSYSFIATMKELTHKFTEELVFDLFRKVNNIQLLTGRGDR